MRPTRVLYVEDDPALRGILAAALGTSTELEIVAAVGDAESALAAAQGQQIDVALLDISLGRESVTGFELGLSLRRKDENVGIVLYSQHALNDFLRNLPEHMRWGWSAIQKRADMDIEYLVGVLKATAFGLNIIDPMITSTPWTESEPAVPKLSARQQEIMSLASGGLDATAIADRLGLAAVTIRQELSRIYQVLVPNPKPGTDLRTTAVLRYLRETRGAE